MQAFAKSLAATCVRAPCDNGSGAFMTAAEPRYPTLEDVIGNTPLVRMGRIPGAENERRGNVVPRQARRQQPGGSVKDRPRSA
jgi:hypothetical protein